MATSDENARGHPAAGAARAPRDSVTVRVPATSANLGPGFDSIGMAVDMWSEITLERDSSEGAKLGDFVLEAVGDGADTLPCGPESKKNLVYDGVLAAFKAAGVAPDCIPALRCKCDLRIPFARGLGSSSAAIVGGIIAGLAIAGHELRVWGQGVDGLTVDKGGEELLQLAAEIEGHPDNVAPALYGGIQLGLHTAPPGQSFTPENGRWLSARVRVPDGLRIVAFIPERPFETAEARRVLPDALQYKEAVFNVSRTALLVNALERGNLRDLNFAMQDALHQPYRGAVLPHLDPIIAAAIDAGAHGCYLSGAGPTVLAITSGSAGDVFTQRQQERRETVVAEAMMQAAKSTDTAGKVYVTDPSPRGAHIVNARPPYSDGLVHYTGQV
eukprot:m.397706 g.397706  ORF g.397706 m.397706 type:complete len:386 (+) comp16773_c2_seq24:25-1182(+)